MTPSPLLAASARIGFRDVPISTQRAPDLRYPADQGFCLE